MLSISQTWKLLALQPRAYIGCLWPYWLLAAAAEAFLLVMYMQYMNLYGLPAWAARMDGHPAELVRLLALPDWWTALFALLAVLLFVLSRCLLFGRTHTLVARLKESDTLPRRLPLTLSRQAWRPIGRMVLAEAGYGLICVLLTALIALISVHTSQWLMLLLLPLGLFYAVTRRPLFVRRALLDEPWGVAIRRTARGSFGSAFVLQLLTSIFLALASLVLTLPSLIYIGSLTAATRSFLIGDAWGVPAAVAPVLFVAMTLCGAVYLALQTLALLALHFHLTPPSKTKQP